MPATTGLAAETRVTVQSESASDTRLGIRVSAYPSCLRPVHPPVQLSFFSGARAASAFPSRDRERDSERGRERERERRGGGGGRERERAREGGREGESERELEREYPKNIIF